MTKKKLRGVEIDNKMMIYRNLPKKVQETIRDKLVQAQIKLGFLIPVNIRGLTFILSFEGEK